MNSDKRNKLIHYLIDDLNDQELYRLSYDLLYENLKDGKVYFTVLKRFGLSAEILDKVVDNL